MVSAEIKNHILNELESLLNNILKVNPEYPALFQNYLLPFAGYILGEENQEIEALSLDSMNKLLLEVLVSLRYPASALPFKELNKNTTPMLSVKNFFESFSKDSAITKIGKLFSILQKELFGHLYSDSTRDTICVPVQMWGMNMGYLAYFQYESEQTIFIQEFEIFKPFQSQNIADNIKELYKSISNNPALNGTVLVYLYSPETNSYFLSDGKGSIQAKQYKHKSEITNLRTNLISCFSDNEAGDNSIEIKYNPILWEESSRCHLELFKYIEYSSSQIWDTKKNYATDIIRKEIADIKTDQPPFHFIFDHMWWFIPFSAAVLWIKDNDEAWNIQRTLIYRENASDENECFLSQMNDEKDLSDIRNKYFNIFIKQVEPRSSVSKHFQKIFDNRLPIFINLDTTSEIKLMEVLGYRDKTWSDRTLKCKSHFVLPVNDDNVPEMIIELFFNSLKQMLGPIVYDISRTISRRFINLRDEFKNKVFQENQLRNQYMGKLAHETNSWLSEIRPKIHRVEKVIAKNISDENIRKKSMANIKSIGEKVRYFSDIFQIILSETRKGKYSIPAERIDDVGTLLNEVKKSVTHYCSYERNYSRQIGDAVNIDDSDELYLFLNDSIEISCKNFEIWTYRPVFYICIQEMLKNAVINHNWKDKRPIYIDVSVSEDKNLYCTVKNIPLKENIDKLNSFCNSILYGAADTNEGFGSLWLKSIKHILNGKFGVNKIWLGSIDDIKDSFKQNNNIVPFELSIILPLEFKGGDVIE